ncbi:MAG: hypothetical protein N3D10_00370 [Candidatus Micrarchaeota archaeon]|nr:hypothetical protein [Candidatus Micrarchaeota archaeon]
MSKVKRLGVAIIAAATFIIGSALYKQCQGPEPSKIQRIEQRIEQKAPKKDFFVKLLEEAPLPYSTTVLKKGQNSELNSSLSDNPYSNQSITEAIRIGVIPEKTNQEINQKDICAHLGITSSVSSNQPTAKQGDSITKTKTEKKQETKNKEKNQPLAKNTPPQVPETQPTTNQEVQPLSIPQEQGERQDSQESLEPQNILERKVLNLVGYSGLAVYRLIDGVKSVKQIINESGFSEQTVLDILSILRSNNLIHFGQTSTEKNTEKKVIINIQIKRNK